MDPIEILIMSPESMKHLHRRSRFGICAVDLDPVTVRVLEVDLPNPVCRDGDVLRLTGRTDTRHAVLIPGMSATSNPYYGFRFLAEIIDQAVWLYHCFSLSLREGELFLAARDIVISYEIIRESGLRFGRAYASSLKRRRRDTPDAFGQNAPQE